MLSKNTQITCTMRNLWRVSPISCLSPWRFALDHYGHYCRQLWQFERKKLMNRSHFLLNCRWLKKIQTMEKHFLILARWIRKFCSLIFALLSITIARWCSIILSKLSSWSVVTPALRHKYTLFCVIESIYVIEQTVFSDTERRCCSDQTSWRR